MGRRFPRRPVAIAAALLALLTRDASAQLLPRLLQPLTNLTCTTPLVSSPKLDAATRRWVQGGGAGSLRVIVSAEPGLLGTVDNLLSLAGALLGDLPGIDAAVGDVGPTTLTTLACAPSVSSISIDAMVKTTGEDGDAASASALRDTLGLPADTPAGAGVGVAVVDSGIAASSDFDGRLAAFYDFTHGAKATAPSDEFGHGTHVAGLIAGAGRLAPGTSYQGVAPQARLIGMKVLDASGAGRTSDVIRAVNYATAHRAALGIQVINLSLGHPVFERASRDPLVRAVEAAARAGIVVVAAAGNYGTDPETGVVGYGGIASPGNAPSAITVGAVMTKDTASRADDEDRAVQLARTGLV